MNILVDWYMRDLLTNYKRKDLEKLQIDYFYKRYGKLGFFPIKYYRKRWLGIETFFEIRGLSANSNFHIYRGKSFFDFSSNNLFFLNLNIILYDNLGYSTLSVIDEFQDTLPIKNRRLEVFEMELVDKLNNGYSIYVPENKLLKIDFDK